MHFSNLLNGSTSNNDLLFGVLKNTDDWSMSLEKFWLLRSLETDESSFSVFNENGFIKLNSFTPIFTTKIIKTNVNI